MASRNEVDITGMRPRVGQLTMTLPVTFDYSGGRADKAKTTRVWAIILGILTVMFMVGSLFNSNRNFFINILYSLGSGLLLSTFIRFILLKENKHRAEKIELIDSDYMLDLTEFWGIYEISELYPYICRFRNGKSGIFVLLNKDVILGKSDTAEYDHYEAIGDGYNIAGSSDIQMCHIDYMDVVGSDDRLDDSFLSLKNVSNPDLKDLLTDIYTFQQEQMSRLVSSFDAYVFLWSGSDEAAWGTIQRILSCFLEANYRSYHILGKADERELTKVLYLLKEFSVENAMLNAFTSEQTRNITPIEVIHVDGSREKLNKTLEERKAEAEERERELAERKNKNKSSQKAKVSSAKDKVEVLDPEEEIGDIF